MVAEAEQQIADRRERLNSQQRRDFDVRRKLAEAQHTLDDLTREQVALLSQEPDVEEIECQPTPLAQTVTGKEVHVLLADDHIAVVPFDALLEQMKCRHSGKRLAAARAGSARTDRRATKRFSAALLVCENGRNCPRRRWHGDCRSCAAVFALLFCAGTITGRGTCRRGTAP